MPAKIAMVDYSKCRPHLCDGGVCAAALACPRKLIEQEAPDEAPMPSLYSCQRCARCVLACPARAVALM